MASRTNAETTASTVQARRHRYARSSTTSVTQLLSESCSSLLQRITTRVRGTSTTADNIASATSVAAIGLGTTRSRLEDKYSAVLDKYNRRRGDNTIRNREPGSRRVETESELETIKSPPPLAKSATTANVMVLSEKAYPFVSHNPAAPVREKTPYRHGEHRLLQQQQQVYTNRLRHKSGQADRGDRPRRVAPPRRDRVGKSEHGERRLVSGLRLCPVEIEPSSIDEQPKQEPVEDTINEREARRKEIQSLIKKYADIDEFYKSKRAESKNNKKEESSGNTITEGKYYLLDDIYMRRQEHKTNNQKSSSNVVSSKYQQKYSSALVPTVSNVLP